MSSDTVPVEKRALAEFVIFNAFESDGVEIYVPDGVRSEDVSRAIDARNVSEVSASGPHIEVFGEFTVPEIVGRIPAGPNRGYGPINPPEDITRDVEMQFSFHYYLEDDGSAEGRVDVA